MSFVRELLNGTALAKIAAVPAGDPSLELLEWLRTSDQDIHQPLGALLPSPTTEALALEETNAVRPVPFGRCSYQIGEGTHLAS